MTSSSLKVFIRKECCYMSYYVSNICEELFSPETIMHMRLSFVPSIQVYCKTNLHGGEEKYRHMMKTLFTCTLRSNGVDNPL